jgi:uroporphyrinogen decarboxylase
MTSKERFVAALERRTPDRLPVTTHHLMDAFLKKYMNGATDQEFFDAFGLDPILWLSAHKPDEARGHRFATDQPAPPERDPRWVVSDDWDIRRRTVPGGEYETTRYDIMTPKKTLSMVLQKNEYTAWISERLIKDKSDIDVLERYMPAPLCDVAEVNRRAAEFGERGLVRGMVNGFDIYGQGGCWQDAACLYGIQDLILATFDDPGWVQAFLRVLFERKKTFVRSMKGAKFDVIEHGGGDASSTVISPKLFDAFVAPWDAELIRLAHEAGQRVVYHTCGGMMPILENVAGMGPDAMETFTPAGMGGDTDLAEAKRRVGGRVCMIGGFDQFHFFVNCAPEETRREVRRCFEAAGAGGGYILSPSDHFFDADVALIRAFAEEAKACTY